MKRFYYISDDLDDLAQVERELEAAGIVKPQVHVFSHDDAGTEQRHLHTVQEFMKRDVVHTALWGAVIGFIAAALILIAAHFSGIAERVHWAPFLLLALIVWGFCTWEAGLFGMHVPHHELRHFEAALKEGKHILFVDVEKEQVGLLSNIQARHSHLKPAGQGTSTPSWAILWQKKWQDFIQAMP